MSHRHPDLQRSLGQRSLLPRPAAVALAAIALAGIAVGGALSAAPAEAHGFSSVVYVDVTAPNAGHVQAQLDLEYDLLVVSAADYVHDRVFFDDGMAVFETGNEASALTAHQSTVVAYATERFTVSANATSCVPSQVGGFGVHEHDGVPYARLVLDFDCTAAPGGTDAVTHLIGSSLFPDTETYVAGTKTIVSYDLDGRTGSAALDATTPSFSTGQSWTDRFAEFFLLGAEHLLGGLDHILFLLALIVGSRRLRDVVLAATTFTVAHSLTFLIAALGLVSVSPALVEPLIALSIAVVAAWHLFGLWRRGQLRSAPARDAVLARLPDPRGTGRLGLDRADWTRLAVVFCFGLIHGLGFASALGIEEAWSWTLLWSLLVFNVGIEAVQLGIIAVVFPLLLLLRGRAPRTGVWAGAVVAAGVAVIGLFWFVQRLAGWA